MSRLPIVVQKYGGSSVADVEKLGRVADRVVATKRAGFGVVVVVSAMGKRTDALLTLAQQVQDGASPSSSTTPSEATPSKPGSPPRREIDMLVSTGERVAMSLLSIAIQARGEKAISFTGSQCGIVTNDRHFDARIIEVRPHRVEDELARGRIVIVAGYQGVSYKREITTLGRGGTDTTAVALAAALSAQRCEIYSDVDGVYSADPRTVANAQHLAEVDVDTLQEMAHAGARVVCAQAVEWARRANVALYARSTFDPLVEPPAATKESVVRVHGPRDVPRARAIVVDRAAALVFCPASQWSQIEEAVRKAGIAIKATVRAGEHATFLLGLTNAPNWPDVSAQLTKRPGVTISEAVARVSVVGGGLDHDPSALVRFCTCLADAQVLDPMLLEASPMRISAVISNECATAVEQRLHAEFVSHLTK